MYRYIAFLLSYLREKTFGFVNEWIVYMSVNQCKRKNQRLVETLARKYVVPFTYNIEIQIFSWMIKLFMQFNWTSLLSSIADFFLYIEILHKNWTKKFN